MLGVANAQNTSTINRATVRAATATPAILLQRFSSICFLSVINCSEILFFGASASHRGSNVLIRQPSDSPEAEPPLSPDRSAQVLEHPELPQEDRHRNVAVETTAVRGQTRLSLVCLRK